MTNDIREQIIKKTKQLGASSAGIARVEDLEKSPTYQKYALTHGDDKDKKLTDWSGTAKSILVFTVKHPVSEPQLDWWDNTPGGTPGNRILIDIQTKMMKFTREEFGLSPRSLPYKLEKGGIFLKDASALAGIGIIGKNNLLITPEYGPRVRLRAMFFDIDLDPTSLSGFDPCSGCDNPCFYSCPQNAFRSGSYERKYCRIQMLLDESNQTNPDDPQNEVVRYCRACEFSCPVI